MRKLAIFSAAFALAAAAYVYGIADTRAMWIVGVCLALSVLGRVLKLRRSSIACLGLAIGLVWCGCYEQVWLKEVMLLDDTEQIASVRITQCPYETQYGAAAECELDGCGALLSADKTLLQAEPGDTVTASVKIKSQADDRYFRADGMILMLTARSQLELRKGTATAAERIRIWLQDRIDHLYRGDAAALVKALLTGDRSGLSYETTNELSVAGLSHAVAVSGMHVSILITMIAMLCGYSPRLTALLGTPVVVLFALMTGASASVCRAAVMQLLLLWAPLVRRERDNATTLAAAALILLLQNPWCIAGVSFQLSFAAVAGLMLFSEQMRKRLLGLWRRPGSVAKFLASGISATLSASVMTLPLTIFYFGLVSVVAPLVNLLALWAVTGVFTLGLCSCCLGPLGPAVAWIVTVLCRYILGVCHVTAMLPFAAAYEWNLPLMIAGIGVYFLAAFSLTLVRFPIRWGVCVVTGAFVLSAVWGYVNFVRHPWRLTALDVGQGQCLVLQIGDFTAVIDCGGSVPQAVGEDAARFFHSASLTRADALILTHMDADHAGGAAQFLGRVKTKMVFLPAEEPQDTKGLSALAEQVYPVENLIKLEVPGGMITIFPSVSQGNRNNSGICVLATAAEYDILITGDMDQKTEVKLLTRWSLPQIDLLVAGHHGAATSTSQVLLETLRPKTVLISVDGDNPYGHPHQQVLDRLDAIGAQVYRTDLEGTIYIYPERR